MTKRYNINHIIVIRKINGRENSDVLKIYDKIIDVCHNMNLSVSELECPNTDKKLNIPKNTLFIAIGGDGTMICAGKQASLYGCPIIGFNAGKRGFLSDFPPNSVEDTIKLAVSGELKSQNRTMINVLADNRISTALNDITISNVYSDTIIHYEIVVNGYTTGNHLSNSIIISTPTGSTAYALSVGGAIIDPSDTSMEIIPVAPLSLGSAMRPMIIPKEFNIEIKLKPRFKSCSYSIKVDGQQEFKLDATKEISIKISKSTNKVISLHRNDWNFYEVLTDKLGWAKI